ncbi:MAG: hypothetical protein IIC13_08240 [SAR324 cluster bacterium]|nr:hypothetical protein [SAR324 cluster bacterium]MCH8886562.1 hypothetical protein [SAR324 cluster bacterium]
MDPYKKIQEGKESEGKPMDFYFRNGVSLISGGVHKIIVIHGGAIMITKHPHGYIFPQAFHAHGISREHGSGFMSALSMEMLAWLRGHQPLAASESILPDGKVILFPANRTPKLG